MKSPFASLFLIDGLLKRCTQGFAMRGVPPIVGEMLEIKHEKIIITRVEIGMKVWTLGPAFLASDDPAC